MKHPADGFLAPNKPRLINQGTAEVHIHLFVDAVFRYFFSKAIHDNKFCNLLFISDRFETIRSIFKLFKIRLCLENLFVKKPFAGLSICGR